MSQPTSTSDSSRYEPLYPTDYSTDLSIKQFISNFFKTSDNAALTDEWVAFFREDAALIMGSNASRGHDEIRKLRGGMWATVAERRHTLAKVFTAGFGGGGDVAEFMITGRVDYRPRDITAPPYSVEFAGHARLERDDEEGPWGFGYYRVWLQRL